MTTRTTVPRFLCTGWLALAFGVAAQPVQVQDDRGVTVSLPRPPQRIVSLLPSLTETVCPWVLQ